MGKTLGVDLMNSINSGELVQKNSELAEDVKDQVSRAMEEIITVGARIRPLKVKDLRVGWVRPLFYSEKLFLERLYDSPEERNQLVLTHCTTLTRQEIMSLDLYEMRSVLKLISGLNLADYSLYPFISAFTSTQASQNLWAVKNEKMFSRERITLPTGESFKLLALNDHIKLWATLSQIRVDTVQRLNDSLNFGILIRAQVGQNASKYVNELTKTLNSFKPDLLDPWLSVVDFRKIDGSKNYDDGFGHSHEDDSVTGMLREIKGMIEGDKHEQLMQSFYEGQIQEARNRQEKVEKLIQRRRELEQLESQDVVVLTDAEIRAREQEIKQRSGLTALLGQVDRELESQESSEVVIEDRVVKYFKNEA